MPLDEIEILYRLKFIWERGCAKAALPVSRTMFVSFNHNKTLNIDTQSLFIAVWANLNMHYALNYLLMDECCTEVNIFGITIFLKQLSSINGAYHCPLIKSIWNAILQNGDLLGAIMDSDIRNLASYSILSLICHDYELETALRVFHAAWASGSNQEISFDTLRKLLWALQDADTQRIHGWALDAVWVKSFLHLNGINPSYVIRASRQKFIQTLLMTCDMYGSSALKAKVNRYVTMRQEAV